MRRLITICSLTGLGVLALPGRPLAAPAAAPHKCPAGTRKQERDDRTGQYRETETWCELRQGGKWVKHGPYRFEYVGPGADQRSESGTYTGGVKHGVWIKVTAEAEETNTFNYGQLHGPFTRKLRSGPSETGAYTKGEQSGPWTFVRRTGDGPEAYEVVRTTFVEGKQHGAFTVVDPRGRKVAEGKHLKGQRWNTWRFFRADGTLERQEQYQSDQPHGEFTWYDATGQKVIRTCKHVLGRALACHPREAPAPPEPGCSQPIPACAAPAVATPERLLTTALTAQRAGQHASCVCLARRALAAAAKDPATRASAAFNLARCWEALACKAGALTHYQMAVEATPKGSELLSGRCAALKRVNGSHARCE
jgi:hypothetical protein